MIKNNKGWMKEQLLLRLKIKDYNIKEEKQYSYIGKTKEKKLHYSLNYKAESMYL